MMTSVALNSTNTYCVLSALIRPRMRVQCRVPEVGADSVACPMSLNTMPMRWYCVSDCSTSFTAAVRLLAPETGFIMAYPVPGTPRFR